MCEFTIKSVDYEQLPDCLEIVHEAFSVNCKMFGFTKENYPSCAAFLTLSDLEEAKKIGTHFYAVFVGDEMAGCVQLKRTAPDAYAFTRFAVLPKYQHFGFGRVLIAHCKEKAREYGGKKMSLLMMYDNEKLRHFYESCGFVLARTQKDDEHPFLCGIYEMEV